MLKVSDDLDLPPNYRQSPRMVLAQFTGHEHGGDVPKWAQWTITTRRAFLRRGHMVHMAWTIITYMPNLRIVSHSFSLKYHLIYGFSSRDCLHRWPSGAREQG